MTLNKLPSGHCGLKVQPMVGWCRVPYGGEGMLDGSKQGSGATLDNYERGSKIAPSIHKYFLKYYSRQGGEGSTLHYLDPSQ